MPLAINEEGTVVGYSYNESNSFAYIRAKDGRFTFFSVPGAAFGTSPNSINAEGTIAGNYYDQNFVEYGFIRTAEGYFTTFVVPGAADTQPVSINSAGVVAGNYLDANGGSHGFVRARNGSITKFDPPASIYTTVGDTTPAATALNPAGAIVGQYQDPAFTFFAYLRKPDGRFVTISGPGSGQTSANSINAAGYITGSYFLPNEGPGFVLSPDGTFTSFNPPGSIDTYPAAINLWGAIAGTYIDGKYLEHGFIRLPEPSDW
jgi:uncharacterized membrane protein